MLIHRLVNVQMYCPQSDAALGVFGTGRQTGLVLDSGQTTRAVAVYEGYPLSYTLSRLNVGGDELNNYLSKLMAEGGHQLPVYPHESLLETIKVSVNSPCRNYSFLIIL